jgi:hypothetical protein
MLHVISLGAGVQSTTMALMAACGEITPMPDCAIFADTQWEPKPVYEHLQNLIPQLPFPVHVITFGNLRNDYLSQADGKRSASIPFHTHSGMKPRHCTSDYKVRPIIKKLRELSGKTPTTSWIGISVDEAIRAKPSRDNWITHRWPLLEKGMNRWDCKQWLRRHGYAEPPKSACICCPYHNNEYWRWLRQNSPGDFAAAIKDDRLIREAAKGRGFIEDAFVHSSLVPLDKVDLRSDAEIGQLDLFGNECEGMCGV